MEGFNEFLDRMTMEELEAFHLHVIEEVALKKCREKAKQERMLKITGALQGCVRPTAMNLGVIRARVGSTIAIGRLSAYRPIEAGEMLFV